MLYDSSNSILARSSFGERQVTEDKLEAQGMFLELLFRGRKAAEPDPVKSLEKRAPVSGLVQ